jgi:anti-sigma factor RsiW
MFEPREMTCAELVELVTEYLEDALPADERAAFLEHLAGCDGCHAHIAQLRAALRVAGALPRERLSQPAEEELVAAFRSWAAGE